MTNKQIDDMLALLERIAVALERPDPQLEIAKLEDERQQRIDARRAEREAAREQRQAGRVNVPPQPEGTLDPA